MKIATTPTVPERPTEDKSSGSRVASAPPHFSPHSVDKTGVHSTSPATGYSLQPSSPSFDPKLVRKGDQWTKSKTASFVLSIIFSWLVFPLIIWAVHYREQKPVPLGKAESDKLLSKIDADLNKMQGSNIKRKISENPQAAQAKEVTIKKSLGQSIWHYFEFEYKGAPPAKPSQWKLHISPTAENAGQVLQKILPIIIKRGFAFKFIPDGDFLTGLLHQDNQNGKAIVIYPDSSSSSTPKDDPNYEQATIDLAKELDDALLACRDEIGAPEDNSTDRPVGRSGFVWARHKYAGTGSSALVGHYLDTVTTTNSGTAITGQDRLDIFATQDWCGPVEWNEEKRCFVYKPRAESQPTTPPPSAPTDVTGHQGS